MKNNKDLFDRKLLEQACKYTLLNLTIDSKIIKENYNFIEQKEMCEKIKKMNYTESISFVFNNGQILDEFGIRDFEGKFKKMMKYGLAGIAGRKFLGGQNHGFKLGALIYYMFRKATDPCWQACVPKMMEAKSICRYQCQVNAAKNIVNDIRSEMGKCRQQMDPIKCEDKLRSQYVQWSKKLQEQIVKLREAEARRVEKERQRKINQ